MFSVRFRRVRRHHRVRRRNHFCLSRQNRLSLTLDIWHKEYMGLGKCTGLTFLWPWPQVTAVASISKKLLLCAIKWEPLIRSLQNMAAPYPFILANFPLKIRMCFSRSNTILAISQEWLVRLMWNKEEVHRLDTGYNIWPWPLTSLMTLTLDVSRWNFGITLSQEWLVWLMWNENEVS